MTDFAELLERIDALSRRASPDAPAPGCVPAELEDLLAEGYLAALTGERRSGRLAAELEELTRTIEDDSAAARARRLAIEKRTVDQRVILLRRRLESLRAELTRLRTRAVLHGDCSSPS